MKIYKLKIAANPHYFTYFDSHVIAAKTEVIARKMANEITDDEGEIWEDVEKVNCYEVGEYTGKINNPHIILSSYIAN